ncbi:MAG: hypothetical protein I3273_00150 [Candidatus Moeniiplasma glomeromycotorum]|nr:hypothetical protein [Candidatus Moeniiplasma glomeromycotorum]MCE8167459.1 hypothetical protein [Candidatus Moeniiplasma glomeromycotorum]MCE8168527.1 hypothetical protein [Candidatus Moeniiplasma glomeromycotorum]
MKYPKLKIRYSRERDKKTKHLTLSWNCFLGMGIFDVFLGFMAYDDGRWWVVVVLFTLFSIFGLYGIISSNAKLKKINQEIEKLKKQEKELKNQLRW